MKDKIVELLSSKTDAVSLMQIYDLLELNTSEDIKTLESNINQLIKENIIYKTNKEKYILFSNCPNLKIGRVNINRSGNGFLLLPGDDLYIDYKNLNGATNDDLVLVELIIYNKKPEGKVLKILNRETKNIIGEVVFAKNVPYLKLDDDRKKLNIELDNTTTANCVLGSKVLVNLVKELSPNKYIGKVVRVIGHKDDPGVDVQTVACKFGFFEEFSKEAISQAESMPIMVEGKDINNRTDLTNELIFTIDGSTTKDIDDAISLEVKDGFYKLGVHIADVSYYVTKDSPLDKSAFNRGTSAYLANSVIPMLPHKLSNGICSLNPNVVRLTITCSMDIDLNGNIVSYDIFPSYIKSVKQMTYEKVNDILMRDIVAEDYKPYASILKEMNSLANILRRHKINRGYIDFDIDEAKIVIDDDGNCVDIKKYDREDGEKLIEDFMIAANETVATHLYNMELPSVYRVHGNPAPERIETFIKLVSLMGYKLVGKFKDLNSKSMQKLLSQLDDKPEYFIFANLLLRSMQKAVYAKNNIGHFGLGSKCYTHFTSPIRRYPDLIVHRLLREYLFEKKIDKETVNYWDNKLDMIAENSSLREQAADEAEREVDDMKMAEYMSNHIGEVYEGYIATLTNYGMYIQLDNLIEGLVHINTLENDYFSYVPETMAIIGQNSKKMYRLGNRVKIKVIGANKTTRMIDFVLLDGDKRGNSKQKSQI